MTYGLALWQATPTRFVSTAAEFEAFDLSSWSGIKTILKFRKRVIPQRPVTVTFKLRRYQPPTYRPITSIADIGRGNAVYGPPQTVSIVIRDPLYVRHLFNNLGSTETFNGPLEGHIDPIAWGDTMVTYYHQMEKATAEQIAARAERKASKKRGAAH